MNNGNDPHRILQQLKTIDQTTFQSGETWYVVEMTWMINFLRYIFYQTTTPTTEVEPPLHPGPITNNLLFHDIETAASADKSEATDDTDQLKTTIQLKRDYRIVCAQVWQLLVKTYNNSNTSPTIAIQDKAHISTPEQWQVTFDLPKCADIPPPTAIQLELVPHVHTTKCNRRVSVCDTPNKFREREIVRLTGKTGSEVGRYIWWKRRRRLGEVAHGSDNDFRDESNLDTWERIPESVGKTQYRIRMEEHDHMIRAQYIYRKGEMKQTNTSSVSTHALLLSNVVGPCEESGPMIHEINILGKPVVGGILIADVDYWGGTEGESAYQWTRVKGGVRKKGPMSSLDEARHVKFDEQYLNSLKKNINGTRITKNDVGTTIAVIENDPRYCIVQEDDVGAKFKVSCTPKRKDGMVGEPKTSRPTGAVC